MVDMGGLFIVAIIGRDATMTQANSGTVVDCASYCAVRRLAWLGRMVFAGIVQRRGPMLKIGSQTLTLTRRDLAHSITRNTARLAAMPVLALSATLFIMGLLVIACVITIVSTRDHDLLQAIRLAAARYVSSGQRIIALYLVVTGRACSAGRVVFRSAHNAGELAPSV